MCKVIKKIVWQLFYVFLRKQQLKIPEFYIKGPILIVKILLQISEIAKEAETKRKAEAEKAE